MVYWHALIFLKGCSFINFILAHEEMLLGIKHLLVEHISPVTTISHAGLPVWKVGINYSNFY